MSAADKTMHMSEDEFREYVNEAFDNGAKAAFDVLENVIAELRSKITAAALAATAGTDERGRA